MRTLMILGLAFVYAAIAQEPALAKIAFPRGTIAEVHVVMVKDKPSGHIVIAVGVGKQKEMITVKITERTRITQVSERGGRDFPIKAKDLKKGMPAEFVIKGERTRDTGWDADRIRILAPGDPLRPMLPR